MRLHAGVSLLLNVEASRNRAVRPAFTTAPRKLHRDHAPPPTPPLPLGPRLPELFHLQQFGKPSLSFLLPL
jgi:hypothetical protein